MNSDPSRRRAVQVKLKTVQPRDAVPAVCRQPGWSAMDVLKQGPSVNAGSRRAKRKQALRTSRTSRPRLPSLLAALTAMAVCVVLALSGCSGDIFTANGAGVPREAFKREVARRLAVARAASPKEIEGSRGEKLKASTEREVATEMIRATLIEDQAAKLGVKLALDAVKQKVEEDKRKAGADKFAKLLSGQGLTEWDYSARTENEMLVDAVGRKVTEGVKVSRDDAQSFYLTHKEIFGRSLMIRAAHIVFDTQGEAEMALDEARSGDFANLAMRVSRDVKTRGLGGDMGWLEKGAMDPAFEKTAYALKSGEVSGVVKTGEDYQIIKVLERREASTPSFEECEQNVMKVYESRRREEVFSDWLRTVYANAKVDTDGVGRWDPRLGMVVEK